MKITHIQYDSSKPHDVVVQVEVGEGESPDEAHQQMVDWVSTKTNKKEEEPKVSTEKLKELMEKADELKNNIQSLGLTKVEDNGIAEGRSREKTGGNTGEGNDPNGDNQIATPNSEDTKTEDTPRDGNRIAIEAIGTGVQQTNEGNVDAKF